MVPANRNVRPFTIYRIICTITGKALIYGSDWPHHHLVPERGFPRRTGQWYERGLWGASGQFWRTKGGINHHLLNLCHDWDTTVGAYPEYGVDQYRTRHVRRSAAADYSRLQFLKVEQTVVNDYDVSEIPASDFLGLRAESAA